MIGSFDPVEPGDRRWMARALERAREARERGEVPIGAVLVRGGVLGREGAHERHEAIASDAANVADAANVPDASIVADALNWADASIVAEASNRTREWSDPTAHAEIVVVREAGRRMGDWRLLGTTLYVTLEPCAQCAGALVLARVPRVVYAAADPKAGMVGTLGNLLQDPRLNHRARVTAGVMAEEAGRLLRGFFEERRGR